MKPAIGFLEEAGGAVSETLRIDGNVAFSGDGRRIASGSWDRTARVWDVATGEAVGDLLVHDNRLVHVKANMDGSKDELYDERGHGKLWDLRRGQFMLMSSDAEWTSSLYNLGLARYCWTLG